MRVSLSTSWLLIIFGIYGLGKPNAIGIVFMKMHSVLCLKCVINSVLGLITLTLVPIVLVIVSLIVLWTISFSFFKR